MNIQFSIQFWNRSLELESFAHYTFSNYFQTSSVSIICSKLPRNKPPSVVSSPRRTKFTDLANTPRTQPQTSFNELVILKNSSVINFHWIYQKRLKTIAAFFSPIGLPKIIFNIPQTLNHSTTCTISQLGELNGKRERATSAILLSGARPLYKRCANEVCNRR